MIRQDPQKKIPMQDLKIKISSISSEEDSTEEEDEDRKISIRNNSSPFSKTSSEAWAVEIGEAGEEAGFTITVHRIIKKILQSD